MNEAAAREVLLLQAFESVSPASASWTDEDRDWATRLALQDAPAQTDEPAFVAARARHAMQRLAPREPTAAKWLTQRLWRARWLLWVGVGAAFVGVLADSIGSSQRINLLAPPLWGVLLWNLVVYVLLLGHAVAGRLRRPGAIVRRVQWALRLGRGLPGVASISTSTSSSALALQSFASQWPRASAPLNAARASAVLHTAAAALALGLIGGLYLRGLVLDYRAAWESTFLSAHAARAALALVFAPASMLSGITLPDVAGFESLRAAHGSTATGAEAAPWIHLWALTLLVAVLLPRTLLALWSGLRANWLERHVDLPLAEPYFRRLAQRQRGEVARVQVLPYARTPTPQAVLGARALLAAVLGDGLQMQIAPTLAFGAEDDAAAQHPLPADTTLVMALFDLTSTPEAENHGRFVQQLAARAADAAATIVLVDEAGFVRRFGAASPRLAQRREVWRRFAETLGSVPVFADLEAPDLAAAQRALQAAIASPVRAAA